MLGANPHGYQLGVAMGILHGLDRIFRGKSAHYQSQFAVGCGLDGKPIDAKHILGSMSAAAVHFHNELDVFHGSFQSSLFVLSLPHGS
jgi:hypothetical protein